MVGEFVRDNKEKILSLTLKTDLVWAKVCLCVCVLCMYMCEHMFQGGYGNDLAVHRSMIILCDWNQATVGLYIFREKILERKEAIKL